jgi:nitrogen fixation NifU-like protein
MIDVSACVVENLGYVEMLNSFSADKETIMKLYKERVMDHYQNPRNRGKLEKPDFATGHFNPSCGDSVSFDAYVEHGKIKKIMFSGEGCAVSQAAASMLTEHCVGKPIDELLKLDKEFMLKLVGMPLGPMRVRCALLALQALHQGIGEYKDGNDGGSGSTF